MNKPTFEQVITVLMFIALVVSILCVAKNTTQLKETDSKWSEVLKWMFGPRQVIEHNTTTIIGSGATAIKITPPVCNPYYGVKGEYCLVKCGICYNGTILMGAIP
jgi:hypothetical protein